MIPGIHLTPIGDDSVLLEPGEGLDPTDPDGYLVPLLAFLQKKRARFLIYDLKNVALVDRVYYDWMTAMNSLCLISGIRMVVANIRPYAAFALSQLIDGDPPFSCALDVDSARQTIVHLSSTDAGADPGP
ncbi:MAG: hypothetical protein ACYDHM_10870 [Acidiferrobacterales bacterium]